MSRVQQVKENKKKNLKQRIEQLLVVVKKRKPEISNFQIREPEHFTARLVLTQLTEQWSWKGRRPKVNHSELKVRHDHQNAQT